MSKLFTITTSKVSISLLFLSTLTIGTNNVYATQPKAGAYQVQKITRLKTDQATLIDKGIRNGQLTEKETSLLLLEQRQIRKVEANYMQDNALSRREANALMRMLFRAKRNITNEMQDKQRRPSISAKKHP